MSNEQDYQFTNDGGGEGIFVNDAMIVGARSVSNEDVYKNNKPVDIGIEFELEIGKDFKPKFTVAGTFKMEGVRRVGPGSTTRVKIALQRLGVNWTSLNPDNSIPQAVLDQCIGKVITRLQYPYKKDDTTGKNKYATFTEFFLASKPDAKVALRAKFDAAVAAGYVKMLSANTGTAVGDAVPAVAGGVSTEPSF